MTPADQGLGADQAAVGQMQLRLIEQFEFVALRGQRQFGFQRQAGFELAADRVLEQHMTAAPGRLGAAQRQMGVAQEFVRGAAVGGETAAPMLTLTRCCALPASSGASKPAPIRSAKRLTFSPISSGRNRDGEFVAAQSRDHAGCRNRRRQPLRHRAQHEIAAGVAEHVVDLLEAVEADHQ